jgi:hypothetical protein
VTARECAREGEVLDAVLSGRWPHVGEDLLMHADSCDICRDVAGVVSALRADCTAIRGDVVIPAAGQVWWRAAVRARMEATHAAGRPMTWFQAVAAAGGVGLLIALIGFAWPTMAGALAWAGGTAVQLNGDDAATALMLAPLLQRMLPFIVAIALCAVLAPVAVLIALSDD